MSVEKKFTLLEAQEKFAKSIYNGIWKLLGKPDRSPSEDEDMLLSAFASLYHWKQIGNQVNLQRGYWMISRVYLTVGNKSSALEWAKKCAGVSKTHPEAMEDFDLAYAEEGLARAYALAGDLEKAKEHHDRAAELGDQINDPEDKEIFLGDFAGGDWYQLTDS
jgi:tetratricopeptide (TPR) repeat protein